MLRITLVSHVYGITSRESSVSIGLDEDSIQPLPESLLTEDTFGDKFGKVGKGSKQKGRGVYDNEATQPADIERIRNPRLVIECENFGVFPDELGINNASAQNVDRSYYRESEFKERVKNEVDHKIQRDEMEKRTRLNKELEIPWYKYQEDSILKFCSDIFCPDSKNVVEGKDDDEIDDDLKGKKKLKIYKERFGEKSEKYKLEKSKKRKRKMVGEALHICYGTFEKRVCEYSDSLSPQELKEKSLPINCFLQQLKASNINIDNDTTATTQKEIFEHLRTLKKRSVENVKKSYCSEDDMMNIDDENVVCDIGGTIENFGVTYFTKKVGAWALKKCKDPKRKSVDGVDFVAINPPETWPKWMPFPCSLEAMGIETDLLPNSPNKAWVAFQARKQRVSYLQLAFMKFERDIYKGEDFWFKDLIRATDYSAFRAITAMQDRKEKFDGSVKHGNSVVMGFKKQADNPYRSTMKQYYHLVPSALWQPMTGWHFNAKSGDVETFHAKYELQDLVKASGVADMVFNGESEARIIKPPIIFGYTRHRRYLSKPELWDRKLWKQLNAINLAHYQAQERVCKQYCIKVKLDPAKYIAPRMEYDNTAAEQQEEEDEAGDNGVGDVLYTAHQVNVCNRLHIHARIAALRTATALAPNGELTEQQKVRAWYDRLDAAEKTVTQVEAKVEEIEDSAAEHLSMPSIFVFSILINVIW